MLVGEAGFSSIITIKATSILIDSQGWHRSISFNRCFHNIRYCA